jgi:putative FmdB family regulatory protein
MPTYEYECQACGHGFEVYQQITAKPVRVCPSCGKASVKRLIGTGAGVLFKGSGFYQTDYRSSGYRKAAKAESESSSSGKHESGKSETAKKGSTGGNGSKDQSK